MVDFSVNCHTLSQNHNIHATARPLLQFAVGLCRKAQRLAKKLSECVCRYENPVFFANDVQCPGDVHA